MAKNRNQGQDQGQVKSKGEEENKKPSLGSRIRKYIPWRIGLTIAAFLIPIIGPIIGTLVGILAYGHYRKKNRTDSTPKPGNENDKSNNEKNKEESKKQSTQPPGLGKKALYRAGAIAAGFMLGGPIGAVIAGIFVAIDIMSNGKIIQGVEKLLDASYGALSWLGKKALGIGKWAVNKVRGSEQGQKAGRDAAGEERETGKEQVAERGVTEEKLRRSGQNGPSTQEPGAPGSGGVQEPKSLSATNMSTEVKRQVEQAAKPLVEAENPSAGIVQAEGTVQLSSSNGQGVNGSASKQPVPPTQTQGQVAQTANSEDGVKAGGTKTNREVVGDATERLSKKDSADRALSGRT